MKRGRKTAMRKPYKPTTSVHKDDPEPFEAEPVADVEVVEPEPEPEPKPAPEPMPVELPVASYSPAPGDDLPLPGGSLMSSISGAELVTLMQALGIEGADHHAGRAANVAVYAAHIGRIRQEAGDAAVEHFLTTAAKKVPK
jgi:hypothetical protein